MTPRDAVLLIVVVGGVALLRIGWGGRRHAAMAGSALILAAVIAFAARDGAWGISVALIVAMLAACGWLMAAALGSPTAARRRVDGPAATVPFRLAWTGWGDLGRRVAVFLIAVPLAGLAAALVALACQALARAAGWTEANSTPVGLLVFPIAWAILTTWVMTKEHPCAMAVPVVSVGGGSAALFAILLT